MRLLGHQRCSMRLLVPLVAFAALAFASSATDAAFAANGENETEQPQAPARARFLHRLQTLFASSSSASSSTPSAAAIPASTAGSLGGLPPPFPVLGGLRDAWAEERELQVGRRLLDGDHLGVLREMAQSKDLDVIWADPIAARRLLTANPIFKALPGVAALADKAAEDWTADDGLSILSRFRAFVTSALAQTMQGMDPANTMANLERFAQRGGVSSRALNEGIDESKDPVLQEVFAQAAAGDEGAAKRVHDVVFDELWDGLLDKTQLGFGGGGGEGPKEAVATAGMREWVRKQEPALWDLMTMEGDPFISQLMTDPFTPMKVLQDLTNQELQADDDEKEAAAAAADAAGRR